MTPQRQWQIEMRAIGRCPPCRQKQAVIRKAARLRRIAQRKAEGLCVRCGAVPVVDGYVKCGGCRERVAANERRYRRTAA